MHTSHEQCKKHELNAQINVNTPKRITKEQLSLILLYYVLFLGVTHDCHIKKKTTRLEEF